jgi:4-amino-4-deoxy-L-arabinose transferase-like glycosyltransferase
MPEKTYISKLSSVHPLLIAAAVFSVALMVRLVYLNQIANMPTFNFPDMDEAYHVYLAKFINSTGGLGKEAFFRAPLYPYLLAFLLKVGHNSLYITRLIQVIYGSLIPVLTYFLGLKFLGRRSSYWTGGIAAIYPTFVYYDSTLLLTSLMILFILVLVLQLHRCQENPSYSAFALAGIILGLAGLIRPNILLFGPALIVWTWLVIRPAIGWEKALLRYSLMGFVCLFTILPVSIRNYVVSGDSVFIAWQGGFNFYLGNNRDASGWSATAPGIDQRWKEGFLQSIRIAESAAGRKLKKSEITGISERGSRSKETLDTFSH